MAISRNPASVAKSVKKRSADVPRAAIEPLEGRMLLTGVVVNSISDTATGAGVVTLRDAIEIANSSATPTTITFSPTAFATPQTIVLNGNQLELSNTSEPTTITGSAVGVTINGHNLSRVLAMDSGVKATLTTVNIADGNA